MVSQSEKSIDPFAAIRKLEMNCPPVNTSRPRSSFFIEDILQLHKPKSPDNHQENYSSADTSSTAEEEDEIIDVEDLPPRSKNSKASPLDALFKMTSKTLKGLDSGGENTEGSNASAQYIFKAQPPKRRRKSRTAFTNTQIFELEKRFLFQKYLTPADRDELAMKLGLSNAQVITWFQNRRAKLKRDLDELQSDVSAAKAKLSLDQSEFAGATLEAIQFYRKHGLKRVAGTSILEMNCPAEKRTKHA